jgi:hypothetical protein
VPWPRPPQVNRHAPPQARPPPVDTPRLFEGNGRRWVPRRAPPRARTPPVTEPRPAQVSPPATPPRVLATLLLGRNSRWWPRKAPPSAHAASVLTMLLLGRDRHPCPCGAGATLLLQAATRRDKYDPTACQVSATSVHAATCCVISNPISFIMSFCASIRVTCV